MTKKEKNLEYDIKKQEKQRKHVVFVASPVTLRPSLRYDYTR